MDASAGYDVSTHAQLYVSSENLLNRRWFIVIATGIRIGRDASMELVDTMPEAGMADQIRTIAETVPGVVSVEKTYARKTGLQHHVDLHIQVDPMLTVAASHAIAGRVRATVRGRLPWVADVLVHVEPAQASR